MKTLSHVRLLAIPQTAAYQASLSMGFSRQESTGVGCHCLLCDQTRQHTKKQRYYFANKGPSSQGYRFSSSHVWMWVLNYKESWVWRIDAFELWCWRRLLSPFNCKEIQPVRLIGDQSWVFIVKGCWITQRGRDSWPPEEKNSIRGQRWGLISQSFCVINFY